MKKTFLALFVLILFIPACGQAREKFLDIHEITSPGGIKAWLVEDHSVPVIALQFSFKGAGAANDPAAKQGLARMASNTMDEGAGDLDSQTFQKELRDRVISLYFNTGRDHFGGTLKTLRTNKDRAFELLQMALTKPRFDEEPLERMRRANQGRIRSALSDPEWMAARILNDVAFTGHPYAQNSGGTLSTLESITRDDLQTFLTTLSKDRLVISAAGDITAEELAASLDQIFGGLPATAPPSDIPSLIQQNQGQVFLYEQDIPQTVIEMMQPGIDIRDPDYQAAQVMNFILGSSGFGSRLTRVVREERGLTYGIYSYFSNMDKYDGLAVSTSTQSPNVGTVLELIKAEWSKIREVPVSAEELKNAKSYLIGSLPLSLTSTDSIAGLLLSLQADNLPIDYLDQRETAIRNTTVEDVQRVAQRLLDPAGFTTVLVGKPQGKLDEVQTIEELPNVE
jgi:zinc protease